MKKSILILALVGLSSLMSAQFRVALHSNGNVTIFGGGNPFTEAYNAAVAGDTIYLPGGNLLYPATIDKSLTIKGVGHFPVATSATNKTQLTGNLNIGGNADYLYLEGIHITGTLNFLNNQKADFVTVKRCRLGSIAYNGSGVTPCENNLISESIIDGIVNALNASSLMISNNIIGESIANGTQLGITNNIFTHPMTGAPYFVIQYVTNSSITNNIFMHAHSNPGYFAYQSSGCSFTKNVFRLNPSAGSNTFNDNYINTDINTVFSNLPPLVFDYEHNYGLLPVAETNFLGTDGTQVGIFGGTFPFKLHSVPTNPSITAKTIGTQTNATGELPVQVTVQAQTH